MSAYEIPITESAADSPFIPGTTLQYAWDSVSLTAAMACWRRYQYQILEGLRPRGPARAIALDFGIAFHKGMELYQGARAFGGEHFAAVEHTVDALTRDPHYAALPAEEPAAEDERPDNPEEQDDGIHRRNAKIRTRYHLMRAVVWYLEHYAADLARTIILPSGAPAVELSFRLPLPIQVGGHDMLLSGHIDRAVELEGGLYVSDYKTTKSLSKQFFDNFELSHQLTGYSVGGNAILHQPISGIIIDGIALQVGGVQFARRPTKRTAGQIDEYLETVQDTMLEAERHADSGLYPQNTSACYFCEFRQLCSTAPEYREGYKRTLYEVGAAWNPLQNR